MSRRSRSIALFAASVIMILCQQSGLDSAGHSVLASANETVTLSPGYHRLDACAAKADYLFQNTLNTSAGAAPALINLGPGNTFVNAGVDGTTRTVLRFPLNGGVSLSPTTNVISAEVYTIVLLFSFEEVNGFRRILDFKHGTDDGGVYVLDGRLAFYPTTDGTGTAIAPNTYVQVVLTRDAAKNFAGYVNGVQRVSFVDNENRAIVDSFNRLRFFRDNESDGATDESSAGTVARIRLFDCAFSALEVGALDRLPPPPAAGCAAVSHFDPTAATTGTAVIISGSGLTGVSTVRFSPNVNANFVINSDSVISTSVPAGAANGPIVIVKPGCADTVTAQFTVVRTMTCVSAASFQGGNLATESIISCFGNGFATAPASAQSVPLPTVLAGATVVVKDRASSERQAGLFFVSPTQLNCQIPAGTALGLTTVTATSSEGTVSRGQFMTSTIAPGIFAANANGLGVPAAYLIRVKPGNLQNREELLEFNFAQQKFLPKPIEMGPDADQLFLVLFGTGWRFRSSLSGVGLTIGGVNTTVAFAGDQFFLAGLDQLNALLPRTLIGRGDVNVNLTVDGELSNTVMINFK